MEKTGEASKTRWQIRLEFWSTVLLAIATLMTAWCAYESSLWNGMETFRLSEANTASRIANEKLILSHQDRMIHIELFMSFLEAKTQGNHELAKFYLDRFPEDLKMAHDAWMAKNPLQDLDAPSHPFAMSEYESKLYKEAKEQFSVAHGKLAVAQQANKVSDNYVLCTVLFASVLFLAGVSTRFALMKVKMALFILGCVVFVIGIFALAHLPIALEWGWK